VDAWRSDDFLGFFNDHDVAPYLLAKSVVVSIYESEECTILARQLGSYQLKFDHDFLSRLNLVLADRLSYSTEIISISLDEESVKRPFMFSAVSEAPSFDE
jgi:hypothetical protein